MNETDNELTDGQAAWPAPGLNPYERAGRCGVGGMRGPGQNTAANAVVTGWFDGHRRLVVVERGDGLGWALPGGHIEPGETALDAAVRELQEETGLSLPSWPGLVVVTVHDTQYVPDPRATDEAWIVTTPVQFGLGELDELPAVAGADDARRALWVFADNYGQLLNDLREYRGVVFPAHHDLLADLLA